MALLIKLECQNCGSPLNKDLVCEYCGARYVWSTADKSMYIAEDEDVEYIDIYADGHIIERERITYRNGDKLMVVPKDVEYDYQHNVLRFNMLMSPDEMREAAGLPPTCRDEKGRIIGHGLRKERR